MTPRIPILVTVVLAAVWLPAEPSIAADSRGVIPFQGAVAVQPGQTPLDADPYPARFEIHTLPTTGTKVFEDIQSVTIRNGAFSVELGGGATPLNPSVIADNPDLWLEVAFDLDRGGVFDAAERILPRTHLGAAPLAIYAQQAGQAQTASVAAETSTIRVPAALRDASNATVGEIGGNGAYVPFLNLPTNAAPANGGAYRNNACVAWGLIGSDGSLIEGFGIQSVSFSEADFAYTVRLFNNVAVRQETSAFSVQVTSFDDQQRPEEAIYEPLTLSNTIGVSIFGLDGAVAFEDGSVAIPLVRSAFSITVFGLPN
jgi:hypothetical protein